jgi:hypothetical protein
MQTKAKCRAFNIVKTKKHTPEDPSFQVVCEMCVVSQGEMNGSTFLWYGSLKGGAIPITLEALKAMGMQGNDVTKITEKNLQNPVRLDLERSDNGRWQAKAIYPLNRDLGEALREEDAALLRAVMLASTAAPEPGANDAPDPEDAQQQQRGKRGRARDENPFHE